MSTAVLGCEVDAVSFLAEDAWAVGATVAFDRVTGSKEQLFLNSGSPARCVIPVRHSEPSYLYGSDVREGVCTPRLRGFALKGMEEA